MSSGETNPMRGQTLHPSTFEYLMPTEHQINIMNAHRAAAKQYADSLEAWLPPGPDKTYIMRQHRANAMWANVAITRHADGSPRIDEPVPAYTEQAPTQG